VSKENENVIAVIRPGWRAPAMIAAPAARKLEVEALAGRPRV
jgi:hypothetical protein